MPGKKKKVAKKDSNGKESVMRKAVDSEALRLAEEERRRKFEE